MSLEKLRHQLTETDRRLLELVAARQKIVAQIGKEKSRTGRPTRDYRREKDVLGYARRVAGELDISSTLAESLIRLLIESSLTRQEQARVVASEYGSGKNALVIGGCGKMGQWFATFLDAMGFSVETADPKPSPFGFTHHADWRATALDQDVIVVAATLGATAGILSGLAERRPKGLIFDIGSLKTPLRSGLDALSKAGCRVTSIHPMFGPDTDLLSGHHVIFVDAGSPDATAEAREIFASTMVDQVDMGLDDHDRVIAYVLGLSHALNIAFFTALAESGEDALNLARISSTTFDHQLDVASRVAAENPHMYFEIQALNQHGAEPLDSLAKAVKKVVDTVSKKNEDGFVALMQNGLAYLEGRSADNTEF